MDIADLVRAQRGRPLSRREGPGRSRSGRRPNAHPKLLQSRLGHSSIKTALDIYGHLYEPLDEVAADRPEQLIADAIAHGTRARALTN